MYLAYISHETKTQNALETAFRDYLRNLERTEIKDEDVSGFKKNILDHYKELCAVHSRCKPWSKHWEASWGNKKDFWLRGGNVHFLLLKSKQ